MSLEKIMTPHVVTVGSDEELETIRVLFESYRFHHLLVLGNKGILVGVISDRDLLKLLSPILGPDAGSPADSQKGGMKAHQIMSREPITAYKECSIRTAAATMIQNNISWIPKSRPNQTGEGIVTWKDIMKWLVEKGGF
jgi:acetoin utilization protein AcuB